MDIASGVQIVADGYGSDHMGGWDWVWMMGGWAAMILLIVLVVWVVQGGPGFRNRSRRSDPIRILEERFARGELSAEEYEARRAVLES